MLWIRFCTRSASDLFPRQRGAAGNRLVRLSGEGGGRRGGIFLNSWQDGAALPGAQGCRSADLTSQNQRLLTGCMLGQQPGRQEAVRAPLDSSSCQPDTPPLCSQREGVVQPSDCAGRLLSVGQAAVCWTGCCTELLV